MEPVDLGARDAVVPVDQLAPATIPERRGPAGGVDDIREQDRRQHPVGVLPSLPRRDLLVRPGERLDVRAGGSLGARLVGQQDDAGVERPRPDEPEVRNVALVSEQAFPAPEHDREEHDPQLVHQVEFQQRIDELGAAEDQDVPVGPLLQSPDLASEVAPDDLRVVPRWLTQGRGHDVLVEGIDPIREPFVLRRVRPERGPDLIRHPPQEDRARREELIDLEPLLVLGRRRERPRVLAVPMLLEARRFHHAIERHELRHHEATHGTSVRCGRTGPDLVREFGRRDPDEDRSELRSGVGPCSCVGVTG